MARANARLGWALLLPLFGLGVLLTGSFLRLALVPQLAAGALFALIAYAAMVLLDSRELTQMSLARLGSKDERLAVARASPLAFVAGAARCANAMEAGEFELTTELLAGLPPLASTRNGVRQLLRHRYETLWGDAPARGAAIAALLEWQPVVGANGDSLETARYHAFALASVLAKAASSPEARRAAARLAAHDDPVVRGYGTWLTLHAEAEDDAPHVRIADTEQGAVLARAAGDEELAAALELEFAREAGAALDAPYRRRQRQR